MYMLKLYIVTVKKEEEEKLKLKDFRSG